MSKKGLKTMLVCIVLLIGLVTLFACNKSDVADKDGQTKVIVKIQDEDGSIYKENVVFSDLFTLSLQKEGYTGRLYRDADFLKPLTKDSKVKNGDTVYVKWTINKYTVTFMDGEKVLETFTNVQHGDTVTAPEVPKKDGKTFSKWDKDFSKVTSDLTINAVYDVDTFTVTFKDGEKVLETQTVEYEAAATAPDTARLSPPEGMHFAKWDKDFSKVTEDIEVSAVYELNEYTVTFKNGETTITTKKVKHGFAAPPPNNPIDTPTAKFVGWDKSFDNVTSDLIVNAKWETKKFTLTFINFDGTSVYTEEVEYGASISDHFETADNAATYDATILDYDGWYKADGTRIDELDLPTMPAENFTLTLKLRLMDSAIGDFKVNTPADFTFTESNTAEFSVMPNEGTTLHKGVTYKYIWTINKDNVFYKTEETTESSLTLQNLAAGEYLANVKIVALIENCGSVEKDFSAGETLIVSCADISDITVTGVTMTYGDKTAKIGISGLRADDVVTYGTDGTTFPLQNVDLSVLNCGEYGYYVRISRGDNYNPYTSGKITVKIDKAEVTATVTPDKDKLTYGDNLPSLTATINGETYKIESGKYELHLGMTSITGDVANNVGTYNIENVDISVLRAKYPEKNYNIALTTVGTIKINEAKLTVTVSLDKTELTYGEDSPIISYTFSGLKSSDKEDDFTITKTELAEKLDAGTYTAAVTISGDKTKFYEINVNTADFTVKQKAATITINEIKDIVYGDKVPDLSAKVEVKGVLDGDSLSYTLNPNYEVGNKPGDYTASVEYDENAEANKNYEITATGTKFKVGEKKLTIKLNNTPTVAIGKTYTVNAEHLEKIGLVAGDTVTGYVTITKDAAGVYNKAADFDTTHLDVTNAGCYKISYEMSVEFVEVKFAIDFADVTLTYDGKPHGVLVTAKEGTNYTITYGESAENCNLEESPKYTNAGAYPIYFKVVDNVTLAEHVGYVTLTISPAKVIVTVNDVTITYGDTPEFSYEATGLLNGDTLSGDADYSGAGTDAGDYVISVSGLTASDNYAVTVKTGTLTINKKTAKADWTIAENYVYSPDGQTLPTATYDGKTANLIFTKDGKACEFKNAGTYTVTIADDNNYDLTGSETTQTIVINKARYTAAPALSLSGTYAPDKTLGNYALSEGFTWADAGEIPVCTKTEYAAKYNMDHDNYEDFVTTVTLVLQKATVTLAQDLFEFNYDDGASREISTTVRYNNIEVTEPYTLTFEKNMFSDAGTHRTLVTMEADNYDLPKNTYVYVKVRGVKVGNNYYTIEEALDVATSGQTIFVLNDTAFATQEIAGVLYNDVKFKTVKTGVTLLLPFNENDTVGHIGAGEDGSANYNATAALTGTAQLYKTLVIPEGIEVIVNGKLVVGAQTGKIDAGQRQNAVSGNYCEISLGGTITLNNATLEVYGYIKGNGEIIANNTTVIENLYLTGWLGGSESAARYVGNREIGVGEALGNELKIDTPNMFPFSQYELRAIQSRVIINKGSKLQGYTKIATGEVDIKIDKLKAQINEAVLTFISSDASNAASGLFRLVGNNSKIVKSMSGDRVRFDLYGEVNDGYTSISIKVVKATVKMASEKVFFPIDGRTDITLKNGATFTQSYMFKALPGATITVESGGIYNLNGKLVMYDRLFTEKGYPGAARGDAKLIVNGTMNVNGAFGGNVTSDNAGTVVVGANATITNIKSIEGNGSLTIDKGILINAKVILHFTESGSVTKSPVFVNADNSTVAAVTNKTYNYNNGTWQ
ncbi:MAG: MBG domain-containing protein [Eubacteriales bacterium]|nr:MBG domain-containing protein [Eubacteriales bacterium]